MLTYADVCWQVRELFLSALPAALEYIRAEQLREEIASVDSNLCISCCNIFKALVDAFFETPDTTATGISVTSNRSILAHDSLAHESLSRQRYTHTHTHSHTHTHARTHTQTHLHTHTHNVCVGVGVGVGESVCVCVCECVCVCVCVCA